MVQHKDNQNEINTNTECVQYCFLTGLKSPGPKYS